MTTMIQQFIVTITTNHGSVTDQNLLARSASEIEMSMPDGILSFQIEHVGESPDVADIGEYEPWYSLQTMVSNLEYAATLTPDVVADNHAQQLRAMAMLSCTEVRYD